MASDDISRLYDFVSDTEIEDSEVDAEFNQLVTTMNNKFGRNVNNTVTGTNTFSGTDTFSNLRIGRTSDNGTLADGQLWYNTTANLFKGRVNSATKLIPHSADLSSNGSSLIGINAGETDFTNFAQAAQADFEAATSTTTWATPGLMHYHPGMCKGWVDLSGTTLNASHNVTSVTNPGTGQYVVNWDTDFSSANYAVLASAYESGGPANRGVAIGTKAAGSTNIWTFITSSGSVQNASNVYAAAFGDH